MGGDEPDRHSTLAASFGAAAVAFLGDFAVDFGSRDLRLLGFVSIGQELDERDRRVVAASGPELHDPRVSARPRRVTLGQIEHDLLDEVDAGRGPPRLHADAEARDVRGDRTRGGEATRPVARRKLTLRRVGDWAEATCLGDEPLGNAPQFLRLRVGSFDVLVENEVCRQVAEHRAPAARIPVELSTRVLVAHGLLFLVLLLLLLPALEHLRPVVDLHSER